MYTPNEVRELSFNKAVFGGYDAADVDSVIASLAEDYATLFKENTMLKKKLKVLADTIEDYRSVDEEMRKALIAAQNTASEMVAAAEKKSRDMLETATNEAHAAISSLMEQIAAEEAKLARAKAQTADFISSIMKIFDAEREKFLTLQMEVAPAAEEKTAAPTTAHAAAPSVPATPVKTRESSVPSDTADEIARSFEEKMRLEEEIARSEAAERAAIAAAERKRAEADEDADMKKVPEDTVSFESKAPTEEEMDRLEEEAARPRPRRSKKPIFENLRFGSDYAVKKEEE